MITIVFPFNNNMALVTGAASAPAPLTCRCCARRSGVKVVRNEAAVSIALPLLRGTVLGKNGGFFRKYKAMGGGAVLSRIGP
jgi:hypothetical protein